jgi:hypothetical protein
MCGAWHCMDVKSGEKVVQIKRDLKHWRCGVTEGC